jgi:hypothetical protein
MERIEIIKTIIELHNFFIIEFGKVNGIDNSDNIWNIELVDFKANELEEEKFKLRMQLEKLK